MAKPTGRVVMGEEEAQQAAERYAAMEAELQALRQRNEELMRAVQEQQELVAAERVRADRQARAQMQEFVNLTAGLLAERRGPEVQLEGMRIGVKVEKPETYSGKKSRDLDTWLFQVREHLDITTIPVRGHVPYAASLLRGNAALWWRETCAGHRRPATWDDFCRMLREQFRPEDYGPPRTRRAGDNAARQQRKRGGFCLSVPRHVFEGSGPGGGGEIGPVRSRTGAGSKALGGTAWTPGLSRRGDVRPNRPTRFLRVSLAKMRINRGQRATKGGLRSVHSCKTEEQGSPVRLWAEVWNRWS